MKNGYKALVILAMAGALSSCKENTEKESSASFKNDSTPARVVEVIFHPSTWTKKQHVIYGLDINGDDVVEFTGWKVGDKEDIMEAYNAKKTHQTKTVAEWNVYLGEFNAVPAPVNTVPFKVTSQTPVVPADNQNHR